MEHGEGERRSAYLALGLIALILLAAALATYQVRERASILPAPTPSETETAVAEVLPSLTTEEGNVIPPELLTSQVQVIMTWASWCPQCAAQLQMMNAVAAEYQSESVAFLAVNRAERSGIKDQYRATLPPLPNVVFLADADDRFYQATAGYTMPTVLVRDATGRELGLYQDVVATSTLVDAIRRGLATVE